jgi:hypothetical protein
LIIEYCNEQRNGGEEMRKYIVCFMGLVMVLGMTGLSFAVPVVDPTGDKIGTGPTDITAAQVEQAVPVTGQDVLKVAYTATPNIGGVFIFEADVDNSTGTGGNLSMTGLPVPPLNTQGKVVPGIDVQIISLNRDQAGASSLGVCTGCAGARARKYGEYFVITAGLKTTDVTGCLRGFSDPTIFTTGNTKRSVSFPWAALLVYVNNEAQIMGEGYTYATALDLTTTKWQLSVWTDPNYGAGNQDDFADGQTYFNLSDIVPNTGLASVDDDTALTFCEGNFDFDLDVDGGDASKFKSDFGRGKLLNPCPDANYFY